MKEKILEIRIRYTGTITPDEQESLKDSIWDSCDVELEVEVAEITYEVRDVIQGEIV